MKIAFWSPLHGTGTSANLMALILAAAEDRDSSVLLTQTHYNLNDLEGPLTSELEGAGRDDFFFNMGIDALIKYFKSGMISKEIMESCAIGITERVSLIAGTRQSSRSAYENSIVSRIVERVFETAEEYYDWVVVDTNAGYSEVSLEMLETADVVIVLLRQNRNLLDALFKDSRFMAINQEKIFYLFGSYDPDSKYNLNNLKHIYSRINSSNSGGIPHSTGYMDALCDRRVTRFIRNGLGDREREDKDFFEALKENKKKIISMIDKAGGVT